MNPFTACYLMFSFCYLEVMTILKGKLLLNTLNNKS